MSKRGRPFGPPKKTGWELALEGMERAAANAGDWNDQILECAMIYALDHPYFDVNEVNVANPECQPHNSSAWGSQYRKWIKAGFCEDSGIIGKASSAISHRHKLNRLKSLICRSELDDEEQQ
jgi:hypothetical protein